MNIYPVSSQICSVSFNLFLQKSQITLTGDFAKVMPAIVINANAEDTKEFKRTAMKKESKPKIRDFSNSVLAASSITLCL